MTSRTRSRWIFAGDGFALDHRDRRGHAFALFDHEQTRRVTERNQPVACLRVEEIEAYYDAEGFSEVWSQGVHARAGGACADCHMAYQRVGALKVSDHWVRSPLLNINRACQTWHAVPEAAAKKAGVPWPSCRRSPRYTARRDFVAVESSMGFHAPQEMARILGETIDYARQAELEAVRAARKR